MKAEIDDYGRLVLTPETYDEAHRAHNHMRGQESGQPQFKEVFIAPWHPSEMYTKMHHRIRMLEENVFGTRHRED